jgi:hypothetical protein
MSDLRSYHGWGQQFTHGERNRGAEAQSYHRVPFVLRTDALSFGAGSGLGNAVPTFPYDLRNDTQYVMEIEAVGFGLQGAVESPADESLSRVGIKIVDLNREVPWFQNAGATDSSITVPGTELFARPSTLVDLASNFYRSNGNDILQWSGNRWTLRYPTLLLPNATLNLRAFSYEARAQVITVSLIGSLLVPTLQGPIGDAALRLGRPWQVPPPHKGDILGYEWVPYVLYSEDTGTAGGSEFLPQQDFRNQSPYDMIIYEVGLYSSLLNASSASTASLPALRVVDASRNVEWGSRFQQIQRLWPGSTNRNAISNQQSQWFHTKWDLGPGTILPSGEKLQVFVQGASTGILGLAFIGALQRPVYDGTPYADAWRKHISASPAMWM